MFTLDTLRELYRHMEWADAQVWRAARNGDAAVDPRLRHLLLHTHVVQRAFLYVWTKQSIVPAFRKPDEFATLDDLREWAQPYYIDAHNYFETVDAERLTQVIELPWAKQLAEQLGRAPQPSTFADTAFQVTSHSTYHRGQVNARLRELGIEPPLVDYIAWVWFGKPAAEWPPLPVGSR
jgi:uncharacterized damage-inducible protein DinB